MELTKATYLILLKKKMQSYMNFVDIPKIIITKTNWIRYVFTRQCQLTFTFDEICINSNIIEWNAAHAVLLTAEHFYRSVLLGFHEYFIMQTYTHILAHIRMLA